MSDPLYTSDNAMLHPPPAAEAEGIAPRVERYDIREGTVLWRLIEEIPHGLRWEQVGDVRDLLAVQETRGTVAALKQVIREMPTWACWCGHTNGSNLSLCSLCGRRPGERR